jgi:hypothetical protein
MTGKGALPDTSLKESEAAKAPLAVRNSAT